MDTGTKTYQIDKHKQLIPLNGNTVNFSCFFEVKSKDKKPFNITIVEQGEIKPKQYKLVDDGYINGQIESDGQLKSYFLVLKAQQPCECNVRVVLKPKEAEPSPPPQPQQQSPPLAQQPPQQPLAQDPNLMVVQTTPESYFQIKYIIGISAVLILLYLVYKYRRTIFGKFMTKETLARSISSTSFY
ncbi:hypothetical protein IIV22A_022L [Invertebrate iridescent virus 22]|uniref:Uncharacterized protein n=1 Tax=Invertebrate iridescent virus 22 TaxID=345198 RepID=W8W1Y0_9VIRU|nr:hypothetical protein IIV22A_022L [Invertebrate iridescent virus 22]CCV01866.1 hypothetical protein IIV22A_022L [Invertebrate iridescent virus 22]